MSQVLAAILLMSAARANPNLSSDARASLDPLRYYLEARLNAHPTVQAARLAQEAAASAVPGSAVLPEPTLGVMLMPAALGPGGHQRMRLSAQQELPWPGELVGRHQAAEARLAAASAAYDATLLEVGAELRRRYWALWEIRAAGETLTEQALLLDQIAETLRARVETGQASLAALQRVDLARARRADDLAATRAQERVLQAELRALVGEPDADLPTGEPPPPGEPVLPLPALLALAERHPLLAEARAGEAESAAMRRETASQRAPDFMVGADWITNRREAHHTGEVDRRQAVMVGAGLTLPLWQGAYTQDLQAARAAEAERQAKTRALDWQVQAGVEAALVQVVEANRRLQTLEDALLPQAEGLHQALLGGLSASGDGLGELLEVQEVLLDLGLERSKEQARLEMSWVDLELRCGQTLERRPGAPTP